MHRWAYAHANRRRADAPCMARLLRRARTRTVRPNATQRRFPLSGLCVCARSIGLRRHNYGLTLTLAWLRDALHRNSIATSPSPPCSVAVRRAADQRTPRARTEHRRQADANHVANAANLATALARRRSHGCVHRPRPHRHQTAWLHAARHTQQNDTQHPRFGSEHTLGWPSCNLVFRDR